MTVNISGVSPSGVKPSATAAFAMPRIAPGASAGVGTLIGVVTETNPAGVLEFTLHADVQLLGPAQLRVEVQAENGPEWLEAALPARVGAGRRVRLSQR